LTHPESNRLKQFIIIIGDQPSGASQITADTDRAKLGDPLIFAG
jgi:hypothetical protein